jgi:serine/threonine protein phosphatase PrpC
MSEEAERPLHTRVLASGLSDTGRVRANNEDTFLIAPLLHPENSAVSTRVPSFESREGAVLLAVSDGMGGAAAGEVASALVIETLRNAMLEAQGGGWDAATVQAVKSANREVWSAAREPDYRGMGATLTAVCVHQQHAYIAAVGDSRAYLLRGQRIRQMTRDQSFVQFMIDSGAIKPEAAARMPMRNLVLQAMGQRPDVEVALGKLEIRRGDVLLLCSDGLSNKVEAEEMRAILERAPSLASACDELVALANERGGDDNVTVVLARLDGEGLQPPREGESMTTTFQVLAEFHAAAAAGGIFGQDGDDAPEPPRPRPLTPSRPPPPASTAPPASGSSMRPEVPDSSAAGAPLAAPVAQAVPVAPGRVLPLWGAIALGVAVTVVLALLLR